jgi:hypothetical protein
MEAIMTNGLAQSQIDTLCYQGILAKKLKMEQSKVLANNQE